MSLSDRYGGVVGHVARRPGTAARAVTLAPGEEYG